MSITSQDAQSYIGKTLFATDGSKIGALYLDDESGQPEWVTVSTGFFGTNESFVPVADATAAEDGLTVPFDKDKIKDAPNVDLDGDHLSESEEATLYQYYGRSYSSSSSDSTYSTSTTGTTGTTGTTDRDTSSTDQSFDTTSTGTTSSYDESATTATSGSGDTTDERYSAGRDTSGANTDEAMTRSEEQLNVGTETVQSGKARLRKWVETGHQEVDVPLRKETVRLESEPIDGGNLGDAYSGPEISEEVHEVTLTEERPVVETEAVPVERVRVAKDVQEETRTVGGDVRKERIDLDTDQDVDDRR